MAESNHQVAEATSGYQSCLNQIAANPNYAILTPHTPAGVFQHPTTAQLTDPNIPSAAERAAIVSWQNDVEHCRATLFDQIKDAAPYMIAPLDNAEIARTAVYQRWVQGTMSWGDGNEQLEAGLRVDLQAMLDAKQSWTAAENQRIESELADRRRALTEVVAVLATVADGAEKELARKQRRHERYEAYKEEHPERSHSHPGERHAADHCSKAHPC
jgi:hypothetical protein